MALPFSFSHSPGVSGISRGHFLWKIGSAWYYVSSNGTTAISVFRSTDLDASWPEQDSSNRPSFTALEHLEVDVVGTSIHIVSLDNESASTVATVEYHLFNASANTWSIVNESTSTTARRVSGAHRVSIGVRSDGDVLIAYNGPPTGNMGTDYERVHIARRESASWTSDIAAGLGTTKTTTHETFPIAIMADRTNDRFHIFWALATAPHYSTYLNGNTFGHTDTTVTVTNSGGTSAHFIYSWNNGSNTKIRHGYRFSTQIDMLGFNDADSPGASIEIATDITGSLATTVFNAGVANPATDIQYLCVDDNGSTDNPLFSTGAGNDTWASLVADLTPGVWRHCNIYSNDASATVIGYVYDDSGLKYNEYTLTAAAAGFVFRHPSRRQPLINR